MSSNTPTAYGDWHEVDGKLVDMGKSQEKTSDTAAPAADESQGQGEGAGVSATTPKRGKRGKRT